MNHYFLIASLPMLHLGEKPAVSTAEFLSASAAAIAPELLADLRDLLEKDGEGSGHPFARAWHDREIELRNAAVRHRARRRQGNPDAFLRPQEGARVFIQTLVSEAFQAADPLQREKALDALRWRILEELAGTEPFSTEALFAYGLRLRIAWRWAALKEGEGSGALEAAAAATVATADGRTILEDNTQKAESA